MGTKDSFLLNASAYTGLRAVTSVMALYDIDATMRFFGDLGAWWGARDRKRLDRAETNLRRCLPHLGEAEVRDVALRSMRYLFQLFCAEIPMTPRLVTPSTWMNCFHFSRIDEALALLMSKRPVILITGHCGNFEILGFGLSVAGFPLTALARPLDMPLIDDWVRDVRQRRGMGVLVKWGASEAMTDILERGGRLAFIADQNAGDRGLFVPFFGRLASAYKSIGLLALRYEIPIVCGVARRLGPDVFKYEIECVDLIGPRDWHQQEDPLYYITARYSRAIEAMVRNAPDQYFWVHRRWKSRPRHELEGKPFPTALKRKLEALPWMTSADLARVLENSARDARELNPSRASPNDHSHRLQPA